MQLISGWRFKIIQKFRRIQHPEFTTSGFHDCSRKPFWMPTKIYSFNQIVFERKYHPVRSILCEPATRWTGLPLVWNKSVSHYDTEFNPRAASDQGNRVKERTDTGVSLMVRSAALAKRLEPCGKPGTRQNTPPHPSRRPDEGLLRVRARCFCFTGLPCASGRDLNCPHGGMPVNSNLPLH